VALTATPGAPARPPRWHAHGYNRAGYYRIASAAAPRVPRPLRAWLAARLAALVAGRFPVERRAVRDNLARVHPGRDAHWLEAAADRVFARFAVCFADRVSLNRATPATLRRHVAGLDDQAPTREALARGRGCVSLTAHLGNWELAGRALAVLGRPVHVVMAPEADPRVEALLDAGHVPGPRPVRLGRSPLVTVQLAAALRRGEVVAFQVDRALGGRGDVAVPFFGAPVAFPLGPFLLAAAVGAPVVPAFCLLGPDNGYRLHVESALPVARGEEGAALERAVRILERHVRAHWDQWFNFYPVWGRAA
jgi:lauroyl/myristoyl acyltransferase